MNAETELLRVFQARVERNPRYSLRAFARDLGVPSGRVSEILSGKRAMTAPQKERIAERLFADDESRRAFVALSGGEGRALRVRSRAKSPAGARRLAEDELLVVTEWYHYAILNLLRIERFDGKPATIARRLGLPKKDVDAALASLARLGLATEKKGAWHRTTSHLVSTTDVPSAALRMAHENRLAFAARALAEVPVSERDFSSVTFVMDRTKLDVAKGYIADFRRRFAETMASEATEAADVFQINVQLMPLTLPAKRDEN